MEPIYLFITINLDLEEVQMKNKPQKTNNLKKASFFLRGQMTSQSRAWRYLAILWAIKGLDYLQIPGMIVTWDAQKSSGIIAFSHANLVNPLGLI